VILTDTGPLVALLDRDDPNHQAGLKAALALPSTPLLTTWPCFTEAMYLLGSVGGFQYQAPLWQMIGTNRLVLHEATVAERRRMSTLMETYRDRPMDLADASLVAVAESLSLRQVFSFDSDFNFYRLADGQVLELLR
jgi:predicted nucleic acid-binding protein